MLCVCPLGTWSWSSTSLPALNGVSRGFKAEFTSLLSPRMFCSIRDSALGPEETFGAWVWVVAEVLTEFACSHLSIDSMCCAFIPHLATSGLNIFILMGFQLIWPPVVSLASCWVGISPNVKLLCCSSVVRRLDPKCSRYSSPWVLKSPSRAAPYVNH